MNWSSASVMAAKDIQPNATLNVGNEKLLAASINVVLPESDHENTISKMILQNYNSRCSRLE
ncbi:hypothetical protein [Kosakonia quasisacchari]|uniref:hypothetical protein n=1 Tax=Kosakonia quasisacchari TaxID=2529380 RepID=UPI0013F14ADE|nr:hypothetical protein [Kosakonia quasisacchari]